MPRLFYPPLVEPGVYILPWHQRKKRYSLKLYRKNEKLRYDCLTNVWGFFLFYKKLKKTKNFQKTLDK